MRLRWVSALLLFALAAFFVGQAFLDVRPPHPVDIAIPQGTSTAEIGRLLKESGVIRSAAAFRLLAKLSGVAASLQSGRYRFSRPANVWDILQRLKSGDVIVRHVTVPEGLRVDEVLALLAARTGVPLTQWQAALKDVAKGREAEGRLFPETYAYRLPVRPAILLSRMWQAADHFVSGLEPAWLPGEQLRIVASIVEKETSVEGERPLVAAVIRNRLKRHMPLQMDPTVIYGLWREDGRFSGNLRRVDIRRDTPWNTYLHSGLPPTPICNPGAASLSAAAHPADVDYLYFVANGSGGHVFANTLEAHRKNVEHWLAIERQGKKK